VEKAKETVENKMPGNHGAANTSDAAEKPQPILDTTKATQHPKESTSGTSTSTTSSPSKSHKRGPSLKDKIKGEMKVLSGKLSRNEHKVEEGRALKTGLASPTSPSAAH